MARLSTSSRLLASALLLCGATLSAHAITNPPIRISNDIEYMSGGIGKDEAELMETVSPRWAATFEFATKERKGADFAADVHLTVRDSGGKALLDNVLSTGPFMVARLEPGDYQVEAQLGGHMLKQPLHVVAGVDTKATFLFPVGTDMAIATPSRAAQ